MHFISIKPVLSDHLSNVTMFHFFIGRSHKIGLTVQLYITYCAYREYFISGYICEGFYFRKYIKFAKIKTCGNTLILIIDFYTCTQSLTSIFSSHKMTTYTVLYLLEVKLLDLSTFKIQLYSIMYVALFCC
jgi:hypothetical protein